MTGFEYHSRLFLELMGIYTLFNCLNGEADSLFTFWGLIGKVAQGPSQDLSMTMFESHSRVILVLESLLVCLQFIVFIWHSGFLYSPCTKCLSNFCESTSICV